MITAELVRSIFDYDPSTGIFRYKERCGNIPAGSEAGTVSVWGYRVLCIKKKKLYAHRVAWLYVHGEWPQHEIDHENMNKTDNRISNLRQATGSQNKANRGVNPNNRSGLKGAHAHRDKWVSYIAVNGVRTRLGRFDTPEEAHAAYCKAANELFGEFARAS